LIFIDPCIVDDSVEIPTRCSFVIEFVIPKFIEGSTRFERHTAHHLEPVTTWIYKPEAANNLELLMMSGVPLETC
jgi:hypothetical protein